MTCKYVVFSHPIKKMEVLVVFPAALCHAYFRDLNPISAGFIEQGRCCRGSDSLGLESRDDDQLLLDVYIKKAVEDKNG